MSEFKGTQGKWLQKFEGCEPSRVIRSDDGNKEVAQVYRYNSESEQKANALLISKAPEMLEILQEFVIDFDNGVIEDFQIARDRFEKLIQEVTEL